MNDELLFNEVVDLLSTSHENQEDKKVKGYDGLQGCKNFRSQGEKLWMEMWENEVMKRNTEKNLKLKSEVGLLLTNKIKFNLIPT
jgi:hypothetical protein